MAADDAGRALAGRWRDILALHARTQCELDRALGGFGLCASDFEVIDVLADEGDRRVQEIAERVHLSQSALSRLVARLEGCGVVERGLCPEDRRGVRVAITSKGRALHRAALPVQRAVLARVLGGAGARAPGDGRTDAAGRVRAAGPAPAGGAPGTAGEGGVAGEGGAAGREAVEPR